MHVWGVTTQKSSLLGCLFFLQVWPEAVDDFGPLVLMPLDVCDGELSTSNFGCAQQLHLRSPALSSQIEGVGFKIIVYASNPI